MRVSHFWVWDWRNWTAAYFCPSSSCESCAFCIMLLNKDDYNFGAGSVACSMYVILNVSSCCGWIVVWVSAGPSSASASAWASSGGCSEGGAPCASHLNLWASLIGWTPWRSMRSILILFGAGRLGLISWYKATANWWTSRFQSFAFTAPTLSILSAKFSNLTSTWFLSAGMST